MITSSHRDFEWNESIAHAPVMAPANDPKASSVTLHSSFTIGGRRWKVARLDCSSMGDDLYNRREIVRSNMIAVLDFEYENSLIGSRERDSLRQFFRI